MRAAGSRGARIAYAGPERLAVRARPVALKRALANLVGNALSYGGAARLTPRAAGRGAGPGAAPRRGG